MVMHSRIWSILSPNFNSNCLLSVMHLRVKIIW